MALDTQSLSQRKQLRKLLNTLHSVERDRDWVFKRLRMAKKHYAELSSSKTALITQQRAEYEASIDRAGYNNNSSSNGDTDQMGYNNNNNNMNYEGNSQFLELVSC